METGHHMLLRSRAAAMNKPKTPPSAGATDASATSATGAAGGGKRLHTFERLHQEGFAYLADNSYIRSGYRLNYSVRDCVLSLFELHNETLNVWTHMVGSFIFLTLMLYLALASDGLAARGAVATTNDSALANSCAIDGAGFVAPAPWCRPAALGAHDDVTRYRALLLDGRHTARLFYLTSLPAFCPRTRAMTMHPEQERQYYELAGAIFEHSLHQLPSLERFHGLLEAHVGGITESVGAHLDQLRAELQTLQDRLSRVTTDYAHARLLKENLRHKIEGFSAYLQDVTRQVVGADLPVHYALAELHGLADSVRNGIRVMSTVDAAHDVPHWPIFVFMASAVVCLTCSTIFHLMFVYSRRAYTLLSRLDYAGISILIAGSFYPMIYYSFYCHPWLRRTYLTAISVLAAITFTVTLIPSFHTQKYLVARTGIFLALGFFGVVPVGHLIWHFGLLDPHVTIMLGPLLLMGLLYTVGAVVYATKFPERLYPGRFDVFFSSHQLWHLFVVAAALVHFVNALQHYEWRWNTQCDA